LIRLRHRDCRFQLDQRKTIQKQLDVAFIAEVTGLSEEEVLQLKRTFID
jgi:hypothetical protein